MGGARSVGAFKIPGVGFFEGTKGKKGRAKKDAEEA